MGRERLTGVVKILLSILVHSQIHGGKEIKVILSCRLVVVVVVVNLAAKSFGHLELALVGLLVEVVQGEEGVVDGRSGTGGAVGIGGAGSVGAE
jgi:hypothetical protein